MATATVVALGAGAAASLIVTPLAIRAAWATGYLDHPEARKLHTSATALLGGVAVFVSAVIGWALANRLTPFPPDSRGWLLFAGALVALVLGVVDDRRGMMPFPKLAGQALAAALLLSAGRLPPLPLPAAVTWVLMMFAMVALMNAVNFLDNMNGMVGGIAAVTLAAFGWHSATHGAPGLAAAQLALAGACAGFLPWNFPKARIFLGDAGSLFLGYSLGASAVLAASGAPAGWGLVGPVLMLGYPTFDMIFVVITRLRAGRRVSEGGKDHTNHRLAGILQCPIRTVLLVWCSTVALCASGLAVLWLNRPAPALLWLVLWTTSLLLSGRRLSSIPVSRSPLT